MDSNDMARRLDALESKDQIEGLSHEYAHGFDSLDVERVKAVFFPDSELLMGEVFGDHIGLDAIAQAAQGFFDATPVMHHYMSNAVVDVEGEKATATYTLNSFCHSLELGPVHIGGIYSDELERRDGSWGIQVRRFELDFLTQIDGWKALYGREAAPAPT